MKISSDCQFVKIGREIAYHYLNSYLGSYFVA